MDEKTFDWNEVWKDLMKRHMDSDHAVECASLWDKKDNAKRFWEMSRENGG